MNILSHVWRKIFKHVPYSKWNIIRKLGHHNAYWCPGSLHCPGHQQPWYWLGQIARSLHIFYEEGYIPGYLWVRCFIKKIIWNPNFYFFVCVCSACKTSLGEYGHQHKMPRKAALLTYWGLAKYSKITLSRAPLTRGNQFVAVAPWTPNFSDSSLAAAHMTEPVTHMCWSEQISPLVHSSQATWQPFNLSHCIEMPNTHLLGHVG